MIAIQLPWLVFVCLLVFLAGILGVWILVELGRRSRVSRDLRHRLRCGVCSLEYEDRTSETIPICPRCGSRNERSPILRF
jgi:rRNA maturation endonuclease Nob1